jgi:hypothetical protein
MALPQSVVDVAPLNIGGASHWEFTLRRLDSPRRRSVSEKQAVMNADCLGVDSRKPALVRRASVRIAAALMTNYTGKDIEREFE